MYFFSLKKGKTISAFTRKTTCHLQTARNINKLCTHALILGTQRAKKTIDEHMIRNIVAGELP